ncbi:hypothetical protein J1605_010077 [Eschrichtius robustus]|uniref:Uncharacterized protein n=1 Tax=Eschrichtius robustus TaxID=9764 RepID=A0AB34GS95_ESCRO|nr:hypothetical protein J1605_010077 [Eschrichtius robustus]
MPESSWAREPQLLSLRIWSLCSATREAAMGFPGGAVVENLPASAGDTGSSPGLGRSHMPRSSWAREPQLLSLRVWGLCSATGEAAILKFIIKSSSYGASLVAQWLRICLPMQGTRVRFLVWEDPTCHGATKPVCHNF